MSAGTESAPQEGAGLTESAGAVQYDNDDPAYRVFVDSLNYLTRSEIESVKDAYRFADRAHTGQKRLSGEPYITHPLAVAGALWEMAGALA